MPDEQNGKNLAENDPQVPPGEEFSKEKEKTQEEPLQGTAESGVSEEEYEVAKQATDTKLEEMTSRTEKEIREVASEVRVDPEKPIEEYEEDVQEIDGLRRFIDEVSSLDNAGWQREGKRLRGELREKTGIGFNPKALNREAVLSESKREYEDMLKRRKTVVKENKIREEENLSGDIQQTPPKEEPNDRGTPSEGEKAEGVGNPEPSEETFKEEIQPKKPADDLSQEQTLPKEGPKDGSILSEEKKAEGAVNAEPSKETPKAETTGKSQEVASKEQLEQVSRILDKCAIPGEVVRKILELDQKTFADLFYTAKSFKRDEREISEKDYIVHGLSEYSDDLPSKFSSMNIPTKEFAVNVFPNDDDLMEKAYDSFVKQRKIPSEQDKSLLVQKSKQQLKTVEEFVRDQRVWQEQKRELEAHLSLIRRKLDALGEYMPTQDPMNSSLGEYYARFKKLLSKFETAWQENRLKKMQLLQDADDAVQEILATWSVKKETSKEDTQSREPAGDLSQQQTPPKEEPKKDEMGDEFKQFYARAAEEFWARQDAHLKEEPEEGGTPSEGEKAEAAAKTEPLKETSKEDTQSREPAGDLSQQQTPSEEKLEDRGTSSEEEKVEAAANPEPSKETSKEETKEKPQPGESSASQQFEQKPKGQSAKERAQELVRERGDNFAELREQVGKRFKEVFERFVGKFQSSDDLLDTNKLNILKEEFLAIEDLADFSHELQNKLWQIFESNMMQELMSHYEEKKRREMEGHFGKKILSGAKETIIQTGVTTSIYGLLNMVRRSWFTADATKLITLPIAMLTGAVAAVVSKRILSYKDKERLKRGFEEFQQDTGFSKQVKENLSNLLLDTIAVEKRKQSHVTEWKEQLETEKNTQRVSKELEELIDISGKTDLNEKEKEKRRKLRNEKIDELDALFLSKMNTEYIEILDELSINEDYQELSNSQKKQIQQSVKATLMDAYESRFNTLIGDIDAGDIEKTKWEKFKAKAAEIVTARGYGSKAGVGAVSGMLAEVARNAYLGYVGALNSGAEEATAGGISGAVFAFSFRLGTEGLKHIVAHEVMVGKESLVISPEAVRRKIDEALKKDPLSKEEINGLIDEAESSTRLRRAKAGDFEKIQSRLEKLRQKKQSLLLEETFNRTEQDEKINDETFEDKLAALRQEKSSNDQEISDMKKRLGIWQVMKSRGGWNWAKRTVTQLPKVIGSAALGAAVSFLLGAGVQGIAHAGEEMVHGDFHGAARAIGVEAAPIAETKISAVADVDRLRKSIDDELFASPAYNALPEDVRVGIYAKFVDMDADGLYQFFDKKGTVNEEAVGAFIVHEQQMDQIGDTLLHSEKTEDELVEILQKVKRMNPEELAAMRDPTTGEVDVAHLERTIHNQENSQQLAERLNQDSGFTTQEKARILEAIGKGGVKDYELKDFDALTKNVTNKEAVMAILTANDGDLATTSEALQKTLGTDSLEKVNDSLLASHHLLDAKTGQLKTEDLEAMLKTEASVEIKTGDALSRHLNNLLKGNLQRQENFIRHYLLSPVNHTPEGKIDSHQLAQAKVAFFKSEDAKNLAHEHARVVFEKGGRVEVLQDKAIFAPSKVAEEALRAGYMKEVLHVPGVKAQDIHLDPSGKDFRVNFDGQEWHVTRAGSYTPHFEGTVNGKHVEFDVERSGNINNVSGGGVESGFTNKHISDLPSLVHEMPDTSPEQGAPLTERGAYETLREFHFGGDTPVERGSLRGNEFDIRIGTTDGYNGHLFHFKPGGGDNPHGELTGYLKVGDQKFWDSDKGRLVYLEINSKGEIIGSANFFGRDMVGSKISELPNLLREIDTTPRMPELGDSRDRQLFPDEIKSYDSMDGESVAPPRRIEEGLLDENKIVFHHEYSNLETNQIKEIVRYQNELRNALQQAAQDHMGDSRLAGHIRSVAVQNQTETMQLLRQVESGTLTNEEIQQRWEIIPRTESGDSIQAVAERMIHNVRPAKSGEPEEVPPEEPEEVPPKEGVSPEEIFPQTGLRVVELSHYTSTGARVGNFLIKKEGWRSAEFMTNNDTGKEELVVTTKDGKHLAITTEDLLKFYPKEEAVSLRSDYRNQLFALASKGELPGEVQSEIRLMEGNKIRLEALNAEHEILLRQGQGDSENAKRILEEIDRIRTKVNKRYGIDMFSEAGRKHP
jgi:hypothetical protein